MQNTTLCENGLKCMGVTADVRVSVPGLPISITG